MIRNTRDYIDDAIKSGLINYIRHYADSNVEKKYLLLRNSDSIAISDNVDILMYLTNDTEYIDSEILRRLMASSCQYGSINIFMNLIPLIDKLDNRKRTLRMCMDIVTESGNLDILRNLVELGAVIKGYIIYKAVISGCIDFLKYYADKEPKLFHHIIKTGNNMGIVGTLEYLNPDMILYLHSIGVKYNKAGLIDAIRSDRIDLVKVLVEDLGIPIKHKFFENVNSESMLEYLFITANNDESIYPTISVCINKGYIKLLTKIYIEGYIFSQDSIATAITEDHYEIVEFILDNSGMATSFLLEKAVNKDRVDMRTIRLLIKYGAKVRRQSVDYAKKRGYNEVVKYLESNM